MSIELTKGGDSRELSTDINIITAEINAYQRVAGEAIFEIGRRLKHVKENDLAHGEFGRWLETINLDARRASEFITVFDQLGDGDFRTYGKMGMNALYQIATLPPEHRESSHTTSKGETKTPDEMTVRELRELKRQLKEAEQEVEVHRNLSDRLAEEKEQAEQEAQTARGDLDKAKIEAEAFAKEPYGVKLGLTMYEAIEELSDWQKEYSWIITDETEFRKLIEADPNIARMFNRVDKFWQRMADIFHTTRDKGIYAEYDEVEVVEIEPSRIL